MRTLVFIVAAVASVSAAQEKRQGDPRVLVVTGCVDRSWLKVLSVDPFATHVDRFRLRGSKDLLKTLTKDLNGHKVEVTGVLDDPGKTMGTGKTKEIGKKTKIYVGQRDRQEIPAVQDPILEVRSYRNVSPTCR
jgi:hypothetical protein